MRKVPEKKGGKRGDIIIVPTSHIAKESLRQAREIIEREKPDCVAVELDINRLRGMRSGQASVWDAFGSLGPVNFVFFMFMRWVQNSLGKKTGMMPGEEMLAAVDFAEQKGIQVALIDRDIAVTFSRLGRVSFLEKAGLILFLLSGIVLGPVVALFGKGKKIDLNRVPERELIREGMEEIRNRFPGIYRALIEERDRYMSSRLVVISGHYKKIVAFVGAGHKEEMERLMAQESQKRA